MEKCNLAHKSILNSVIHCRIKEDVNKTVSANNKVLTLLTQFNKHLQGDKVCFNEHYFTSFNFQISNSFLTPLINNYFTSTDSTYLFPNLSVTVTSMFFAPFDGFTEKKQ